MEVLAKRLKWLREKKRLSQKEVAAEIGMKTVNGYQKIEMDERNPKLETLVELSKLFKVSTDFLLGVTHHLPKTRELLENIVALDVQRERFKDNLGELLSSDDNKAIQLGLQMQSDLNFKYYKFINDYMNDLLEIPMCNLEEDYFLRKYYPLAIQVSINHIGEGWDVEIISIGETFNHTLESSLEKEEAIRKAEEYGELYNLDVLLFD